MKVRKIALAAPLCAALLAAGGCDQIIKTGPSPEEVAAQQKAEMAMKMQAQEMAHRQKTYKTVSDQFTDIPVPSGVTMNVERTIVLGATGAWLGRLVLSSGDETTQLFDFFKTEMPGMGWQEMTAVRAIHSVLTFSRLGRIATIQIHPGTVSASEVVITASPERAPQMPGTGTTLAKPMPGTKLPSVYSPPR